MNENAKHVLTKESAGWERRIRMEGVWIVSLQQVLRSHECSSSDAMSPLNWD